MNDQHYPETPANTPRPNRRLFRDVYPLPLQETPPHIPQIDEHDAIDRLDTMKLQSVARAVDPETANGKTARSLFMPPLSFIDDEADISAFHTTLLPSVDPAFSTPVGNKQADRLIYANTAYARRLERRRRIEEKKLSWKDMQQFSRFVTPFKWQIAAVFLLTVGVGLTALPMPFIFRAILDEVFHTRDIALFVWLLVMLLAVMFLEELLRFLNRNIQGLLSRSANLNITYQFYRHMLRLPLSFYQGLSSTGQVLSRLNEVTSAQQTVIQVIIDIAVNGILVIIYLGVLFVTDWRLTLAVLGVAPFYLGINLYFNRRVRQLSRQSLESYAIMNGAMYEGLTGLKTVKALAAEHRFSRMIKKLIIKTNQISFHRTIFQSGTSLVIGIVQALGVIIVLSLGGFLVLSNGMTGGMLAAFILVLRQLASPISTLNGSNQQVQAAAVAIDRLFELLNQPEEAEAERGLELSHVRGSVALEHVHFSYTRGIEVLHDINLFIKAGTTVAFVGRSGAGKTTLANLLMRFYQPDSGRITIDGYDLRDLKIDSLRSQFGVILQDDSLFSGTIEENLTFGLLRNVSYPELEEAARNANILDYIQAQPLGFKTILHERGQSLSGGQRQRLAIARMFLRQPKILIMDEPSSALDNESEILIQQALKRLTQGRTTFIIAHRLSTIRNADHIVVIDGGSVAEQGTHDELLLRRGIYWYLYTSYGRV